MDDWFLFSFWPPQILTALGKSWHPEHFVCSQCSQPITEGSFNQRDGMPVCSPCYVAKFTDICHGCNQPILGVSDPPVWIAVEMNLHILKLNLCQEVCLVARLIRQAAASQSATARRINGLPAVGGGNVIESKWNEMKRKVEFYCRAGGDHSVPRSAFDSKEPPSI